MSRCEGDKEKRKQEMRREERKLRRDNSVFNKAVLYFK